jgi:hypothetical protein
MRPRLRAVLALAAVLAAAGLAAGGCGEEEEELDVVEGEPVELGELEYNVQITRFLNPTDPEDSAYLEGEAEPKPGQAYLAVFMTVHNNGEEPARLPETFDIVDTRDNTYEPVETDNPFALMPGSEVGPGAELPAPDTPAASGPIKGAMVLFLVPEGVAENRPLELEIPDSEGTPGKVELDI